MKLYKMYRAVGLVNIHLERFQFATISLNKDLSVVFVCGVKGQLEKPNANKPKTGAIAT